jgi:hypothetical protein
MPTNTRGNKSFINNSFYQKELAAMNNTSLNVENNISAVI